MRGVVRAVVAVNASEIEEQTSHICGACAKKYTVLCVALERSLRDFSPFSNSEGANYATQAKLLKQLEKQAVSQASALSPLKHPTQQTVLVLTIVGSDLLCALSSDSKYDVAVLATEAASQPPAQVTRNVGTGLFSSKVSPEQVAEQLLEGLEDHAALHLNSRQRMFGEMSKRLPDSDQIRNNRKVSSDEATIAPVTNGKPRSSAFWEAKELLAQHDPVEMERRRREREALEKQQAAQREAKRMEEESLRRLRAVTVLQTLYRVRKSREEATNILKRVRVLQGALRAQIARGKVALLRHAAETAESGARKIQSFMRMTKDRKAFQTQQAARCISRFIRMATVRRPHLRYVQSVRCLQSVWRLPMARAQMQERRKFVEKKMVSSKSGFKTMPPGHVAE